MATNWGIVSTGKICHDFVVALQTLDPEEHKIVAVAARNIETAKIFAHQHDISKSYGSYKELSEDNDVLVVYIGSVNTEHKHLTKMMLEAGKHVLCEKPMCLNENDTLELITLARSRGLFLMEAIWSRFFPAYKDLRYFVDKKIIGEVQQINCNFGVPVSNVDRLKKRELGGGTLHDLGIYVLQFQQLFFGDQYESITAVGQLNDEGVDENVSVIITYPNGKFALVSTNSKVQGSNTAEIIGTEGFIQVPDFWCPDKLLLPQGEQYYPLPLTKQSLNFKHSTGLAYEAQEVRECILQGKVESPLVTHSDTLHLALMRDEIRKQIGMVQDGDEKSSPSTRSKLNQ